MTATLNAAPNVHCAPSGKIVIPLQVLDDHQQRIIEAAQAVGWVVEEVYVTRTRRSRYVKLRLAGHEPVTVRISDHLPRRPWRQKEPYLLFHIPGFKSLGYICAWLVGRAVHSSTKGGAA